MLTGFGDLDKLEYRDDVPVPTAGPGEVLIHVVACGMNNTDINTRTGWYSKSVTSATGEGVAEADEDGSWGGGFSFPRIQGADPAGRIVAVGGGVAASRIGQRVLVDAWHRDPAGDIEKARYLGSELDGGYGEYRQGAFYQRLSDRNRRYRRRTCQLSLLVCDGRAHAASC